MSGLSVAVLAGGPSSEAAVSRSSAAAVVAALSQAGHRPVAIELDADLASALRGLAPDVVFPVTHGPVGEDGCVQGLLEVLDLPYVGSAVLASAIAASKPHAKRVFREVGKVDWLVEGEDLSAASLVEAFHRAWNDREAGAGHHADQ